MPMIQRILCGLVLVLAGIPAKAVAEKPVNTESLLGKWRSVKILGKDAGDEDVIDLEFNKNGQVTITVTIKTRENTIKATDVGTWKLRSGLLDFDFPGANAKRQSLATFSENRLVLKDRKIDFAVHYERDMPMKDD